MESHILKEKRRSQRVPVELTVLAEVEERRIAMCSENISLDGMFLFSREFVRPRAIFSARVWISNEEEPLQVYLTSCFIERTWTGYGIGVHISGISAADSAIWEAHYRACCAARADQLRQIVQSERTMRNRRLLVVDGALSPLAMQALRKQGLDVANTASVGEALERVQNEPIDAVISDLHRPGLDGLALCCQVNSERLPTRTVLLTSSAAPREFLLGLYAGATRVIAKPCSNDVLVTRILEVLQQRLPGGRTMPGSNGSEGKETPIPVGSGETATIGGTHAASAMRVASSASRAIGQVWGYVSDRLSR